MKPTIHPMILVWSGKDRRYAKVCSVSPSRRTPQGNPDLEEVGKIDAGRTYLLACGDPVMARLVRDAGSLGLEERRRGRPDDAYGVLVRTIVGQQLSTKAARTIYTRLCALFGDRPPAPEEILAADEEVLRAGGLSRSRVSYLRDLAGHVIHGELDLDALDALPDEEVIDQITDVKGLGRWSADMFKSITAACAE